MSTNRHEKERQRTRLAFMNAALNLILEKGYDHITVMDIVRAADYGRSTFYEHFADKEAIAWAILENHVMTLDAEIAQATEGKASPEQEWIAWVMICEDIAIQRKVFLKMDSEISRRLRFRQKELLIMGFQMKFEAGDDYLLGDVPPAIRARYVVGAALEILDYWLANPDAGTAPEIATIIFKLIYKLDPPEGNSE